MEVPFTRLVRFKTPGGDVVYGEAGDEWKGDLVGKTLSTFSGNDPFTLRSSGDKAVVSEFKIPTFPVVFTKYPDVLAGPYESIPINPEAHELDYEGELSIVIGKDAKNLKESDDPLDYILGFTVGNDVSSRYWQNAARSGSQHGPAKSFDKFGPIGPVVASGKAVGDAERLHLKTWVNGEIRQDGATDDLIFGVKEIVRFLSHGKTLRTGTVIMTGTPSGVAAFMKPPQFLKDGDLVEIEIEKIGKIANKMVFE
ncbi:hypothetical protein LTS17_002700 [Exophiala oligosperma]